MKKLILSLVTMVTMSLMFTGCNLNTNTTQKSDSGASKASAIVKVQANGLTVEQDNVKKRIEMENQPGAIKHLYIVSAASGQAIVYSTVKGKVTSSSKRLTPKYVTETQSRYPMQVVIGGVAKYTNEVLGDDGTYGSSIPYLYWWDVRGVYHQHYVSGGQIVHISDQPPAFKSIIINMELTK